jgi:hypothetical protein
MKRSNVLALVAMVAVVMIWGCSKSSTGPSGPSATDLIGKWVFSSAHMTGTELMHFGMGLPDTTIHVDTTVTMTGNANYAQLYSDMTYSMHMPSIASLGAPAADSGEWSLSGSNLRMIDNAKDTTNLSASVNGNNGTFVNVSSQTIDNPTGTLPGSYLQTSLTFTIIGAKQ